MQFDELHRTIYATDASVYREKPLAVALPTSEADLRELIDFAGRHGTSLIPRTAGTSLAGQCVGDGIVVDLSRHFTAILEVNQEERWVRVQPGVIRDELNRYLRPYGLFFGPNTSTSNRAMIGGMVGNNSCGSTSIVYGSTRDHALEIKALLSDGSPAHFRALSAAELEEKLRENTLEGRLYRQVIEALQPPDVQERIRQRFPKPSIHRRNTGYALDELIDCAPFNAAGPELNLCRLLCGSEGTLAVVTEIKLGLDPLPPPAELVVAAHFDTIRESLQATLLAMEHRPDACELMDKVLLDCTKESRAQRQNRFFVEGDPGAILCVEFRAQSPAEAEARAEAMIAQLRGAGLGYAYPIVRPPQTRRVWELRKAGLGSLSNVPGDAKPVACIEDTAVALEDLPDYIADFEKILTEFGQQAVFYAHAGAGELHLRPFLNLKDTTDRQLFRRITAATAELVHRYGGSLSGEHGDGRVRSEFIERMIGTDNYRLLQQIKNAWDPQRIFNPGKIVDPLPMDVAFRYEDRQPTPDFPTMLDFSAEMGILRAAEKCNGSGDCRKLATAGGTMCPSYQATREEKDSTRGRANALREILTRHRAETNPFAHPDLAEAMDLCLSCKGCTAECPSNVDMAGLKAEYLHQRQKTEGVPLRSRVFGQISRLNALGSWAPSLTNWLLMQPRVSGWLKKELGVAEERSLPKLHATTLRRWMWWNRRKLRRNLRPEMGRVYFFADEFTNFNDTLVGIKAVRLLHRLGYEVILPRHRESGRAAISKGLLHRARCVAVRNVEMLGRLVTEEVPLVAVEPSAILGFRDEYLRLVPQSMLETARRLAERSFTIEEFLCRERDRGKIGSGQFSEHPQQILLHGHCHQKALSSVDYSVGALSIPANYHVEVIPSGCCGMAGSFGYEKEHFELSQQIAELVLMPAVRQAAPSTLIAAPGTSCRHQILDATGKQVLHPVEILWQAAI